MAPDSGWTRTRGWLHRRRRPFRAKDRNRDGFLTRGEYADPVTFDRVDRNNDGRISYDEYLNPPRRGHAARRASTSSTATTTATSPAASGAAKPACSISPTATATAW